MFGPAAANPIRCDGCKHKNVEGIYRNGAKTQGESDIMIFVSLCLCGKFKNVGYFFTAGSMNMPRIASLLGGIIFVVLVFAAPAPAVDYVTFRRDGKTVEIEGRLIVKAEDGGLLMQTRDGVLWAVLPEEKVKHEHDDRPFEPYSADELAKRLLSELPQGFKVRRTAHYVIFHDTSTAYAEWCGALFEQLYRAFANFWSRKGFDLRQPEFPLAAIVFADKTSYLNFSKPELGEAGQSVVGYFALMTNRMTMYDLTGVEALGLNVGHGRSTAQINQVLSQPAAQQTVSTIVHEATHQIAFNCGLHARLSDCPVCFSEGIAMYFETPDLRSSKGWSGLGALNRLRLEQFQKYLAARPADSLAKLIRDDRRFRDTRKAADAYAEAWALTYFLLRQHPKQYIAYLSMLSKKKPLFMDDADERIDQFRKFFGELDALDAEFVRYIGRVR
jgi:hypothetical protein